jgi:hypothetical protein
MGERCGRQVRARSKGVGGATGSGGRSTRLYMYEKGCVSLKEGVAGLVVVFKAG